jgi:PHD/YefM family antitoxin component YafN of YafNO toxin-antitoxin module
MKANLKAIVSNSDMMKNYKSCREKAEAFGKIFILKNNQPDAVLMSISEYEKVFEFIAYLETAEGQALARTIDPDNMRN